MGISEIALLPRTRKKSSEQDSLQLVKNEANFRSGINN